MQVVHIVFKDGADVRHYRHLLHRHCQQAKSASNNYWLTGTNDNDQIIEEPDELKGSSPVLKPSGGGDSVA